MGQRIWTILYALWLAAVVVLSLDPSPPAIDIELLSWDKFQHAGAYAVMTLLGGLSLEQWMRAPRRSWLASAAIAVTVGLLLEVAQGVMQAGRFADWRDAAANGLGAAGVLGFAALLRGRRSGPGA